MAWQRQETLGVSPLREILGRLAPYREAVDAEIVRLVTEPSRSVASLYGMMRYHLGWADRGLQPTEARAGKRLRPILCLLTCEATSGRYDRALPAASAVELLHNFSLIHDDIEDQDAERHGRSTVWSIWGVAQGINTGDAMFALARIALHALFTRPDVPGERAVTVLRRFDETTLALCQGQYLDLAFEAREDVDVDDYLEMIWGKTSALLAFATEAGAQLGGATDEQIALYRRFGESLGLAFQMIDDELGVWGDTRVTGKPVGADRFQRKKSLPVVHALCALSGSSADELRRLYGAEQPLSDEQVGRVIALLEESGAQEFVRRLADRAQAQAMQALVQAAPQGKAGQLLRELATALLGRQY